MRTCYAFDMDGVLLDSRLAVEESYLAAGVRMPSGAWGLPWREWLIEVCNGDEDEAKVVHNAKNALYPAALQEHGRSLPARDLVLDLFEAKKFVRVLTGASNQGAFAAMSFLDLPYEIVTVTRLTNREKTLQLISMLQLGYDRGMYFDDEFGVEMPSEWESWHVR